MTENLEQIVNDPNISTASLNVLRDFILMSDEYQKLFRCTQMRDEVLRDSADNSQNRGIHTIQVATNAAKLCRKFFEAKNPKGEELTGEQQKQVLIAEIVGLAHDLGHTPMGHASEDVFSQQIGKNLLMINIVELFLQKFLKNYV